MAKTKGCGCWPFFRSKSSKHKQVPRENLQRTQISMREEVNFMNGNVAQRNQINLNSHRSRTSEVAHREGSLHNHVLGINSQDPMIRFEELRNRNKVRIRTHVKKAEVEFVDDYPQEFDQQKIFKFCCPICLRYFNTILVSSCCGNYMCRFCIGVMAKKAKSDVKFVIKCPHCFEDDFKLEDVKPEVEIKIYTDTPYKHAKTQQHVQSSQTKESPSLKSSSKNSAPLPNHIKVEHS